MKSTPKLFSISILALLSLVQFASCQSVDSSTANYPKRPVKLIVPFAAGGGSDTFARILAKAIEDHEILPQPLIIINVPGAGGTIGSRRLKNARPDGYTYLFLHEGIITSKYSGRVSYGPEAFEVIAGMGVSTLVIAVGKDSRIRNLKELMQTATDNPDEFIFSANLGSPSHFAGLMLENVSPEARFRYAQTGGGAKRFAALQGGHSDVSAFALSEYIQFKPSGLRAIALLGPKRIPEVQEVPTAIEQGFDVLNTNMQFWWAPKGTPQDKMAVISKALSKAMRTPEVQEKLSQLNITPVILQGKELAAELSDRTKRAAAVSQRPTVKLPNFPFWISIVVVALGMISLISNRQFSKKTEVLPIEKRKTSLVVAVLVLTFIYVALMQSELLGYLPATLVYLIILGYIFAAENRKLLGVMAMLSVGLSIGLFYLFTEVFVIDLP
ncbi:tripartite tricarboxylate transporter substrate-binding protein [bacterium]|nr:tripartite tricarboxylate transporter substrate-binding protein [bacterium]